MEEPTLTCLCMAKEKERRIIDTNSLNNADVPLSNKQSRLLVPRTVEIKQMNPVKTI